MFGKSEPNLSLSFSPYGVMALLANSSVEDTE